LRVEIEGPLYAHAPALRIHLAMLLKWLRGGAFLPELSPDRIEYKIVPFS
jgi:hypothetical protein